MTLRCPYCPATFPSLKALRCHVTMLRRNAKNYHNRARDKHWIVRDETGALFCLIAAASRDKAINAFCYPALRKEAYFGPDGDGWACEEL